VTCPVNAEIAAPHRHTRTPAGNAGRNIVIRPQFTRLDLTLSRNPPSSNSLTNASTVNSMRNFLIYCKHPNTQGAQYGSAVCGSITEANRNREFEFGLRLAF
jgi:hypothetical protein